MDRSLEDLKLEARAFKRVAFAEASKRTYKSQLKCYLQFCIDFSQCPVPASSETLTCYLAYLAKKIASSSIPNYLNVVRLLHVSAELPNPLENNFELKLIKKGIKREKGVPPIQKLPISIDILQQIYSILDLSNPEDLSFWAACLIAFFGFMRKSTILPSSMHPNQEKVILRKDIKNLSLSSFELQIRHSKVIQFGEKIHTIPFSKGPDYVLCPVRALLAHLGASPLSHNKPLFNYMYAGSEKVFTQSLFSTRLQFSISHIGLREHSYSAHSFRRGGASYAFELGISPVQIKLRGDWASAAFERYIFISSGATAKVAKVLAEGVVNR